MGQGCVPVRTITQAPTAMAQSPSPRNLGHTTITNSRKQEPLSFVFNSGTHRRSTNSSPSTFRFTTLHHFRSVSFHNRHEMTTSKEFRPCQSRHTVTWFPLDRLDFCVTRRFRYRRSEAQTTTRLGTYDASIGIRPAS